MTSSKKNFLQALMKMARSLSTEDWYAMVAVKGVKFPYSLRDKVKIIREMIDADRQQKGSLIHL